MHGPRPSVDDAATLFRQGHLRQAAAAAGAALERAGDAMPPAARLQCLTIEGFARAEAGPWSTALDRAQQAFELACTMPQESAPAPTLNLLAGLHARLGRFDEAEMLGLRALALARQGFDDRAVVQGINTLLALMLDAHDHHRQAGRHEAAAATLARLEPLALQGQAVLARETDPFRAAVLRSNLAGVELLAGRLDVAERWLVDVARSAADSGFDAVLSRAMSRQARCAWLRGDLERARRGFIQVWCRLRADGLLTAQEDTLGWMAQVAAGRGRTGLAARLSRRSGRLAQARQAHVPPNESGPASVFSQLDASGH